MNKKDFHPLGEGLFYLLIKNILSSKDVNLK